MGKAQSVQINLRVTDQVMAELDGLAQQESVSCISLARMILLEGIAQRKREMALRLYREGKASKSRAAEIAGISLWEMLDLVEQAELPAAYSLSEAVEDVRRLVAPIANLAAETAALPGRAPSG
jgi:predicted HTH domain antitoxin